MLAALSDITNIVEEYCTENGVDMNELLETRLAPDMFTLTQQFQRATFHAARTAAALSETPVPDFSDDQDTFADIRTRIKFTTDFLSTFTPEQFEGSEKKTLEIKVGPTMREFLGEDYLYHFAIPQVLFHCTTAYNIMRAAGAELGKRQFLGSPENR